RAAKGDPLITMAVIQKSINKWVPRGLEMFGDERGGDTNVKFGFKDMKNREAQDLYLEELRRMVRDINARFLRARFASYTPEKVEQVLDEPERSATAERCGRRRDRPCADAFSSSRACCCWAPRASVAASTPVTCSRPGASSPRPNSSTPDTWSRSCGSTQVIRPPTVTTAASCAGCRISRSPATSPTP